MKEFRVVALVALACEGLWGCNFHQLTGAKTPVGQVVAVVDGQEITAGTLDVEVGGTSAGDPKLQSATRQAVLKAIISRMILADAARANGLDKTPEFAIQKQKAIDALLVQILATKIAAAVPQVTSEEAESFMASHPDGFAQRKIYTVDQIRTAPSSDPSLFDALKPLNTLEDVEGLLTRDHIAFRRITTDLDALSLDPKISDSVAKLSPNEVFVIPTNGTILISQIKQTRVEPFTGPPAVRYAVNLLQSQRTRDATLRELGSIVAKGASSVKYNQRFAPAAEVAPAQKTAG